MINMIVLLSVGATLIGCGSNPSEEKKGEDVITITDLQNRKVTIDKSKVDRVICLGAGALRMYSYVGDVSKLVAVEEIDKTPFGVGTALRPYYEANKDAFTTLPTCGKGGPAAQKPDPEAIIANEPNIIISLYSDPSVNEELSASLNVPVVALSSTGDGVFDNNSIKSFELLGQIFNKEARATELVSYINEAKKDFENLEMSTTTNYVGCVGNWGKTNLYGSYANYPVFKYAHATNVVDSLFDISKQVTVESEKLIELNPDHIFFDGAGYADFLSDYKENKSKYASLSAIENGETYILLPYNAYYTNLEIQIISTYYVASVNHPTAFKNFDIEAKANEVSKKFLGKDNLYTEYLKYSTAHGGYHKINIEEDLSE